MSTFLVDPNASQNDIVGALNYALANLGAGTTGNSTAGVTQIVAGTNISISPTSGNGIVTISASVSGNVTLSSNIVVANSATSGAGAGFVTNVLNSGLSSPSVLSYLYPYLNVKYSNSPTGAGMVSNPYGQSYYGIHNNESNTVDNNPVDYSWYLVTGGFGTNKLLWYTTNGGGQANFIPSIAQPSIYYSPVQDDTPILIQTLSNNAVATTNIQAAAVTGYNISANTITAYNIAANTITGNLIAANTITGNLIAANTIQGNSIVAGSITATQLQANLLTVGNIVSTNATIEVPTGAGYWLDYTNGNVYFGGNTQVGANLIVGNNAVIGNNLTIGGLVTNGSLVPNVVATTNLIQGAVNQTITAVDNSGSNLLGFTNGNIAFPAAYSYWPTDTRGYAITANLTPQSNTSTIIVNFSTYINSTANTASNCVELWRSGNANIALNVYNAITTIWPTSNVTANVSNTPIMMAAGTQGQGLVSYNGGQSWITANTNAGTSVFTGILGATGNVSFPTAANVISLYTRANTSTFYSGNLAFSNARQFSGNLSLYGTATYNWTCGKLVQSQFNQQPAVIGGTYNLAGTFGSVAPIDALTGNVIGTSPGGAWSVYPVNGITTDVLPRSSVWNTAANATTAVYTVTCHANGEVRGGTITFNSGYNLPAFATIGGGTTYRISTLAGVPQPTLTAIACNATGTARANTFVTVGTNFYNSVGPVSDIGIYYSNGVTTLSRATSSWQPDNSTWTGVAYGNGWWVATNTNGLVAISNNPTASGSPGWTVLSNTYSYLQNRTLTSVEYNAYADKFVITGNSIVMTSTPGSLGSWTVSNVGTRATGLTRLAYYGSWYDPGRVDVPLATQQLVNGSVVSGTAIDPIAHTTTGGPITYYLVAGNMSGLQSNTGGFIYVSNPSITVTEQKR